MPLPQKRRQLIPKPPPTTPTIKRDIDPAVFSGYERYANMKDEKPEKPRDKVASVGVQG